MGKAFHMPIGADAVFVEGLQQIRRENEIPSSFPPQVMSAADSAARRPLGRAHIDRTDLAFVTLDPATSTDLDQAFVIEEANGGDLLLRYAIADVAWFVSGGDALDNDALDNDALDNEAWARGVTTYLPDGRASLYPPVLSEAAASLLPDGSRPAVVFSVRVSADGAARLDGVERAVIRSRAKLAYETAGESDLPQSLTEFARRIEAAEDLRGASRVETLEQEVIADGDHGYRVIFRPRTANEDRNAAMSLATNMAVAEALYNAGTGMFRIMPEPDERSVRRLRYTAQALGLRWPPDVDLRTFQRGLRGTTTPQDATPNAAANAAFAVAIRRAAGGASYASFEAGVMPWHSAMAATYCHSTAPLRRLGDRFNVVAALAVANGNAVPDDISEAFARLPATMDRADSRSSRVERSVIDMVEAVMLHGLEGHSFDAVVTDDDEHGARIQLCDPAVLCRVSAHGVSPGDNIRVRLISSDPVKREVRFERVS